MIFNAVTKRQGILPLRSSYSTLRGCVSRKHIGLTHFRFQYPEYFPLVMKLKYDFSVDIVSKLLCGRDTKGRKRLIFTLNSLTLFINYLLRTAEHAYGNDGWKAASPEQARTFKLVLMKILFPGPKHHLGQVFYSEESCSKLPYMAATQIP